MGMRPSRGSGRRSHPHDLDDEPATAPAVVEVDQNDTELPESPVGTTVEVAAEEVPAGEADQEFQPKPRITDPPATAPTQGPKAKDAKKIAASPR